MSHNICFMVCLVSAVTMRGPRVTSPYSAVFEIESRIPAMPLAATLLTAALGKRVLRGWSHVPAVVGIGISLVASVILAYQVAQPSPPVALSPAATSHAEVAGNTVTLWTWAAVPLSHAPRPTDSRPTDSRPTADFRVDVTLRADSLTAVMLVTVTLISWLVAVYSIGYMHGDPGYWRFFTYIALFVFSMTMLVSVSNFVLLYVFWEGVGLCSYLLIGFWFQKPAAAAAGKKAFLVNRVGDFGFALGVFLLWTVYGTLDFFGAHGLPGVLDQTHMVSGPVATAICLLLMLGACGKSAQFPLHVWLPDAMEGPTPVSALIHAATMVTAGVYMVARCMPLFAASPDALEVVAVIGGVTALLGGAIAVTQTDLKRILAYSTISQLGYMFLALGAGGLLGATAGMFHLVTHAFFKALLFLAAGSVMHAMGGVIDIRRLGGLWRRMPWTHATFLVGCLALAGVFPFAGFFSKDEILAAVQQQASHRALFGVLYAIGLATAFLTAFYAFRAFFCTFHGQERIPEEAGEHAHEAPPSMTGPLVALAAGSLVVGAWFWMTGGLTRFLAQSPSLAFLAAGAVEAPETHGGAALVALLSTALALAGIAAAWYLYVISPGTLARLTRVMQAVGLYGLSYGKFFFDQIYAMLIVWPLEGIARLCYQADRYLIDTLVDLVGLVPKALGAGLRSLQGGMIQFYALAMALGLLVLLLALFL